MKTNNLLNHLNCFSRCELEYTEQIINLLNELEDMIVMESQENKELISFIQSKLSSDIESVRNDLCLLKSFVKEMKNEFVSEIDFIASNSELQNAINRLHSNIISINGQIQDLLNNKSLTQELKEKLIDLEYEFSNISALYDNLNNQVSDLRKELSSQASKIQDIKHENTNLINSLESQLSYKINELKNDIDGFAHSLETMHSSCSQCSENLITDQIKKYDNRMQEIIKEIKTQVAEQKSHSSISKPHSRNEDQEMINNQFQNDLSKVFSEIQKLKSSLSQKKSSESELILECNSNLNSQINYVTNEVTQLNSSIKSLNQDVKVIEYQVSNVESNLDEINIKLSNSEKIIENAVKTLYQCSSGLENLDSKIDNEISSLESKIDKLDPLLGDRFSSYIESNNSRIDDIFNTQSEILSMYNNLNSRINDVEINFIATMSKYDISLANLDQRVEDISTKEKSNSKKITDLENKFDNFASEITTMHDEIKRLCAAIELMSKADVNSIISKSSKIQEEFSNLSDEIKKLKSDNNFTCSVKTEEIDFKDQKNNMSNSRSFFDTNNDLTENSNKESPDNNHTVKNNSCKF